MAYGCWCLEIIKCRGDRERLKRMMRELDRLEGEDAVAESSLFFLGIAQTDTNKPYNIQDTADTEARLHRPCRDKRISMMEQCWQEIASLESELKDMIEADKQYHMDEEDD